VPTAGGPELHGTEGVRRVSGPIRANKIPGTTILDGIGAHSSGRVTYSEDASAPIPSNSVDMRLSSADRQAVDMVCAATTRCVVVIVSGRPLILDPAQLQRIDGLVAAWLPGSEGIGVADPLFGARPYTGKLPVTWPRSLNQEPINVGDAHYDPLFPFGYGLRTR
jgi:beta-glucosidase